ncbi:hypothetical protein FA95DRAFT_1674362 [Auriscalpium vulgare]|uniref:Uncharacterized protein n=1 Tax=Auriscalpium vulgare TaxID=40419 RepID=A0ACB8SAW1_9AGAM|nr:hypothetical protein FA95DRAFT_1674362 [Auriscalpium vulgare]
MRVAGGREREVAASLHSGTSSLAVAGSVAGAPPSPRVRSQAYRPSTSGRLVGVRALSSQGGEAQTAVLPRRRDGPRKRASGSRHYLSNSEISSLPMPSIAGVVRPERLPDHVFGHDDPALSPVYSFADAPDPPPNLRLRTVRAGPVETNPPWAPERGLSAESFPQRLLLNSLESSTETLTSLVATHDALPEHTSTASYNLLLAMAIRHAAYGTAQRLFLDMRRALIRGDARTWQLRARFLVRQGRWPEAWTLVMQPDDDWLASPLARDGIPVAVWAELLGTTKRGAMRRKHRVSGMLKAVVDPDPGLGSLSRYGLVMRQQAKLAMPAAGPTGPPPRAIYASVDALLRMGEGAAARELTVHFLKADPRGLGLRLLHLHIRPVPAAAGTKSYYRALRVYSACVLVAPELRPNATTLFLLLGHLKGAPRASTVGYCLMRFFRRQWGARVVGMKVWRRLLALAVREGQAGLVRKIAAAGRALHRTGRMRAVEREVLGGAGRAGSGRERRRWGRVALRAEGLLRRRRRGM